MFVKITKAAPSTPQKQLCRRSCLTRLQKGNLDKLPFKHTRSERLERQTLHRVERQLAEVAVQAYLGDGVDVQLHEGTRVTGYAPNSEDAISKLNH